MIICRGVYYNQITSENKIAETVRNEYLSYQKKTNKNKTTYNYLEIPHWSIMQNRRFAYDDVELKYYLGIKQNTYGKAMKFSKWYPFYKVTNNKTKLFNEFDQLFKNEPKHDYIKE